MRSFEECKNIVEIIRQNPKGMSITGISNELNMNRNSVAKYVNMLHVSGNLEMRTYAAAKVYFLSQRIPVSRIIDYSSDYIIILDENLRIIEVNDNFLSLINSTRNSLVNKNIIEQKTPILTEPKILEPLLKTKEEGKIQNNIQFKSGYNNISIKARCIPTVFEDGSQGTVIILKKNIEKEPLNQFNENLCVLLDLFPDILYKTDDKGNFSFINQKGLDMLEISCEEIIGSPLQPNLHPDDLEKIMKKINDMFVTGKAIFDHECRFVTKFGMGKVFPVVLNISLIRDNNEKIIGTQGIARDISKIKQAEKNYNNLSRMIQCIQNLEYIFKNEKDRRRFLKGICCNLIDTFNFSNVLVVLTDEFSNYKEIETEGTNEELRLAFERIKFGEFPACGKKAMQKQCIVAIKDTPDFCQACSLSCIYMKETGKMAMRLGFEDELYGFILAIAPLDLFSDGITESLFEIAIKHISFALHNIKMKDSYKIDFDNCIIKASLDGFVMLSPRKYIKNVNKSIERITGFSREELINTKADEYFTDWKKFNADYKETIEKGFLYNSELKIRHKSGEIIPALCNASVNKDSEGNLVSIFLSIKEISDLNRTQEENKRNAQLFKCIIDQSYDLIFLINREGKFNFISQSVKRILGYDPKELTGTYLFDIIDDLKLPQIYREHRRIINGEHAEGLTINITNKAGAKIVLEINASPILKDGEIIGVEGICRDLTNISSKRKS